MNYDLAKELKDAGFYQPDMVAVDGTRNLKGLGKGEWQSQHGEPLTYIPTLEELIEACGDTSFILGRTAKRGPNNFSDWSAQAYDSKTRTFADGATPTEAVARLWLALNKKEK
jgi:hypothetical protein